MISALKFLPIATCEQENILINKVLFFFFKGKSEKNVGNKHLQYSQYNIPP